MVFTNPEKLVQIRNACVGVCGMEDPSSSEEDELVCAPCDDQATETDVPPPPPKGSKVCNWSGCKRGNKRFKDGHALRRHIDAVHKKLEHRCTIAGCDRTCTNLYQLSLHIKSHAGAFTCTWPGCKRADKPFGSQWFLQQHVESVHKGMKAYACFEPGCNKTFSTSGNRIKHVAVVHEKQKPFSCAICDHTSASKANLEQHTLAVHEGKRDFVCGDCSKSFSTNSNLEKHRDTVHLKLKPFECRHCEVAFGEKRTLAVHVRTIHDDEARISGTCIGLADETGCVNGSKRFAGDLRYGKRCIRCFIATFPNDPRAIEGRKWLNAKEITVREFLASAFPMYRWTFDRAYAIGTRVRPDAKLAASKQSVILVEVDEKSHDAYDCGEERERERVFASHIPKGATVALIRFNPDAYDDVVTGERVPSCFRYSQVEKCVSVNPDCKEDWEMRTSVLKDWVQHFIDHPPELFRPLDADSSEAANDRYKYVFPVELFYDDVRAKWPNGKNVDRVASNKAIGKKRKRAIATAASSSAQLYDSDSD